MLKSAPRILAIILLIIIAALMVIAGNEPLAALLGSSAEANDLSLDDNAGTPPADDAPAPDDTPAATLPDTQDETPTSDGNDGAEQLPKIFSYDNFPKEAATSDLYLYTQSIDTDGELELKAVHQTPNGIFLIIEGAPTTGDFSVSSNCVSAVRVNEDGKIDGCLSLVGELPSHYLASQITTDGLTIAVSDGETARIYGIDFSLSSKTALELNDMDKAKIFPLSNGYVLIAEREENAVYLVDNAAIKATSNIICGEVLEIIELRSVINIVINGINGYSFVTIDKNLNGFAQTTSANKTALKVLPVSEDGQQKYIVVEQTQDGVYVAKHSSSFRESECVRVGLGLADSADVYLNKDTILLLLRGSNSRVYLMDVALNLTLSTAAVYKNVNKLHDCVEYSGGYLMLTENASDSKLSLTDIRTDGSTAVKSVNIDGVSRAFFTKNTNGTVTLIYNSSMDKTKIDIAGLPL